MTETAKRPGAIALGWWSREIFPRDQPAARGLSARLRRAAPLAVLCEPEVQFVLLPRRTLKTPDEIDAWADEARQVMKAALSNGPVVIK